MSLMVRLWVANAPSLGRDIRCMSVPDEGAVEFMAFLEKLDKYRERGESMRR